jgi:hypothetical protein
VRRKARRPVAVVGLLGKLTSAKAATATRGMTPATPVFVSVVGGIGGVPSVGGKPGVGTAAIGAGSVAASRIPASLGAAGSTFGILGGALVLSQALKGPQGPDVGLLNKYADALQRIIKTQNTTGMKQLAAQLRETAHANQDLTKGENLKRFADALDATAKSGGKDISSLQDAFARLPRSSGGHIEAVRQDILKLNATNFDDLNHAIDQSKKHFEDFRRTGSNNMDGLKMAVQDNMHFIRRTLGSDSAAGQEALAKNFRLARSAIRQAMADGKIATKEGLAEIKQLMRDELKLYGVTGKTASAIIRHGDIKNDRAAAEGTGGGQRGGRLSDIKAGKRGLAVGGWIGGKGMVSKDMVPIAPGAIAAFGEYLATGPGGDMAVLNRHQAPIANAALAMGGYGSLDTISPASSLPILEQAMAPLGGLDALFATVTRPHYLARGGYASGGAIGAANKLDHAHFPYVWGGGHQATPAPFGPMDCSGAVSYVLQNSGVNIPTSTSGQLSHMGRPGAGPITVFANNEHTFMRIGNRYFGTSGQNPGGGAGWFQAPGAGYLSRFAQRHFTGAGFTGAFSNITAPQTGLGGALGSIVQGGLNLATKAANSYADRQISAMGVGTGDAGDPGPVAKGSYTKQMLIALWERAGGRAAAANIAAAIALAESGGDPNAGRNHPYHGLWQIGPGGPWDPLANAKEAVRKSGNGRNWTPWTTYTGYDTPNHEKTYLRYLAKGGHFDSGRSSGTQVQDIMKRGWSRAKNLFPGRVPSSPPEFVISKLRSGVYAHAAYPLVKGRRRIALNPDMVKDLRMGSPSAFHALLHEWAHTQQGAYMAGQPVWMVEGGAEAFAQDHDRAVWGGGKAASYGAYAPYVAQVRKTSWLGKKFINNGQFMGGKPMEFASGGRPTLNRNRKLSGSQGTTGNTVPMGSSGYRIGPLKNLNIGRSNYYDLLSSLVEDDESKYSNKDRLFNIDVEEFTNDDGTVNTNAVNKRVGQLDELIAIRKRILVRLQSMYELAKKMRATYRRIISRLRLARKHTKGKSRDNYNTEISHYESAVTDVTGDINQLKRDTIPNTQIDLVELGREVSAVANTQPVQQDPTTDSFGDGTGTDTGSGEPAVGEMTTEPAVVDQEQQVDYQAQIAQLQEQLRVSTVSSNINAGALAAFTGSGPGGGSPLLSGFATDAQVNGTLGALGGGMVFNQYNSMMSPSDPDVLTSLADATVKGLGYQPAVTSSRESIP